MGLVKGGSGGGESFNGTPKLFSMNSSGTSPSIRHTCVNVTGKGILTSLTQALNYDGTVAPSYKGFVEIIIDGVTVYDGSLSQGWRSETPLSVMFKFKQSLMIKHYQNSAAPLTTSGSYILQ